MPVPLDIYKVDVDFTSLALQYPDFAKKLRANGQLNFSNPESVRQLTKALLDRDFGLTLSLPDNRLCPPVPNRFNYILFIQQLLDSTQYNYSDDHDSNRRVIGLDIGTGASAIYPLLGCRQHPSWLFLATEIDHDSKEFAIQNVKSNNLESRIKIVETDKSGETLIPSASLAVFPKIDFLLTNPPFYSSEAELQNLAKQKSRPPNSACTGAPVEMICAGGEVGFVTRLVRESVLDGNKSKIQWFSSMLGRLSSVSLIVDLLRDQGCTNYAVSEFVQGQKTRRWCVAWSWFGLRPSQAVARGTDAVEKKYLPFPTELEVVTNTSADIVAQIIREQLTRLHGMEFRWHSESQIGIGRSALGDVWSRRARRKLEKQSKGQEQMDVDTQNTSSNTARKPEDEEEIIEEELKFVFRITVKSSNEKKDGENSKSNTHVLIRWLQGNDSTVFESFHGWLKRKLQE